MVGALTQHAWHAKSHSAAISVRSNAVFCRHYTINDLVPSSLTCNLNIVSFYIRSVQKLLFLTPFTFVPTDFSPL